MKAKYSILLLVVLSVFSFLSSFSIAQGGCVDNDDDGYGIGDTSLCFKIEVDCNDNSRRIHPGVEEICDNIDQNCNGIEDEPFIDFFPDKDGDTHGDSSAQSRKDCEISVPNRFVTNNGDCDDNERRIHPNAPEVCNDGRDNNCRLGVFDEECNECFSNDDCSELELYSCSDQDQACITTANFYCNDIRDFKFDKVCGAGIDNMICNPDPCPNGCKDGFCIGNSGCVDEDNDGYFKESLGCQLPYDCNDKNRNVNPEQKEICGDGLDNNCDYIVEPCDGKVGPDLVIEDLELEFRETHKLSTLKKPHYLFKYTITNIGNEISPSFSSAIRFSPSQPQRVISLEGYETYSCYAGSYATTSALEPGESIERSDYFNPIESGEVKINIKLDDSKVINELNEENNEVEKTFNVEGLIDPNQCPTGCKTVNNRCYEGNFRNCFDSDSGKYYYEKGYTDGQGDYCSAEGFGKIVEHFCSFDEMKGEEMVKSEALYCPLGCSDGACIGKCQQCNLETAGDVNNDCLIGFVRCHICS